MAHHHSRHSENNRWVKTHPTDHLFPSRFSIQPEPVALWFRSIMRKNRVLLITLIAAAPFLAWVAVNRWRSIPEPPSGIYLSQGARGFYVFRVGMGGIIQIPDHDGIQYYDQQGYMKGDHFIVRITKWKTPVFENSGRPEFEFAPSSERPGDWDLVRLTQSFNQISTPGYELKEKVLDTPIRSYLHRLDDPDIPQYFDPKKNSSMLARELLQAHPDDPFIRTLYLESISSPENLPELEQKLAEWKSALEDSPSLFLQSQYRYAALQARGYNLSKQGKNASDFLLQMTAPFGKGTGWDLATTIRRVPEILNYKNCIVSKRGGSNFLDQNFRLKALCVISIFQMMEGKRDQALELLLSMHYWGFLMGNEAAVPVSSIGAAFQNIAVSRLQLFVENCCETQAQCAYAMRRLDAIAPPRLDEKTERILEVDALSSPFGSQMTEDITSSHLIAESRFDLARMTLAAKGHFIATGVFPSSETEFAPLLPQGLPVDRFSSNNEKLKFIPNLEPFLCYSIGPDKKDDRGQLKYDPSNGVLSSGDLFVDIPREREYPFPAQGTYANSKADLLQQYPNGLPTDVFADTKGRQLSVTNTNPVYVYSVGPDQDEQQHVRTPDSLQVSYDPTNGTMSSGDLFVVIPAK